MQSMKTKKNQTNEDNNPCFCKVLVHGEFSRDDLNIVMYRQDIKEEKVTGIQYTHLRSICICR